MNDAAWKGGKGRESALARIEAKLGAPWVRIMDRYVQPGLTYDPAFDLTCTLEVLDLALTRVGCAFTPDFLTASTHALDRLVQRRRERITAGLLAAVTDLHDTLPRLPEAAVCNMINARFGINPREERADLLLPGPSAGA